MDEPITQAALLDMIRTARAEWDALLERVDEARMVQPGVAGDWSVMDIVAHIAWHEREMIGLLQARALVGSNLWDLPLDERNQAIFESNRHRSLDDVRIDAQQTYQEFVDALGPISDEDLIDARRFANMPAEWQPWKIVAENSCEHYRDHVPSLRAWLEEAG